MLGNHIISLTTIPPRFGAVLPTLKSLLEQSIKAEKIYLNIPKQYRRFSGEYTKPVLNMDGITINYCDYDYGPATKILPILKNYSSDKKIIYCDDDIIYHHKWSENIINTSIKYPNDCICARGQYLELFRLRQKYLNNSDNIFINLINKQKYRRRKKEFYKQLGLRNDQPVDIAAGYGGVLINPRFFRSDVFDIPEILWTVDDIWLSGQLATNGIRIRLSEPDVHLDFGNASKINPLTKFIYRNHSRDLADMECVRYFSEKYNIWTA